MITTIANTARNMQIHMAKISFAVLTACILTAVFYAVSLYALISHSVTIQQTEKRIVLLGSALSKLDAEYLKLMSVITPDSMAEHGLVPGHVSLYITRPAPTASIDNLASMGNEL